MPDLALLERVHEHGLWRPGAGVSGDPHRPQQDIEGAELHVVMVLPAVELGRNGEPPGIDILPTRIGEASELVVIVSRSALLPVRTGKTISGGSEGGDFLAAAAIAPNPARQTVPSAITLITWQARNSERCKGSRSNEPGIGLCCLLG